MMLKSGKTAMFAKFDQEAALDILIEV